MVTRITMSARAQQLTSLTVCCWCARCSDNRDQSSVAKSGNLLVSRVGVESDTAAVEQNRMHISAVKASLAKCSVPIWAGDAAPSDLARASQLRPSLQLTAAEAHAALRTLGQAPGALGPRSHSCRQDTQSSRAALSSPSTRWAIAKARLAAGRPA